MKKMNEEEFMARKRMALEKAVPHLLNPNAYPMPRLTLGECAVIMAPSPEEIMTTADVRRLEEEAFAKMRTGLGRIGIRSIADAISPA